MAFLWRMCLQIGRERTRYGQHQLIHIRFVTCGMRNQGAAARQTGKVASLEQVAQAEDMEGASASAEAEAPGKALPSLRSLPSAVAHELRPDGLFCNLPPPTEDDIAKMQWMGDLEAAEAEGDDQLSASAPGGHEQRTARATGSIQKKLANKTVEELRFDFDGHLVPPSRTGEQ